MSCIEENFQKPLEIFESVTIRSTITGDVVINEAAELRLLGEVIGTVIVRQGGALILIGRVKGEVRNEGGAVDIFGFAGRVLDVGAAETYVSRGAIIGGHRASRPSRLSSMT